MNSCEILKHLGIQGKIPKASKEGGQLHKKNQTVWPQTSQQQLGGQDIKEQCFNILKKVNLHPVRSSLKGSTIQIFSRHARSQEISFSKVLSQETLKGYVPPK